MFGEITKLLDRNFAIAFFLPTLIFLTIQYYFIDYYSLSNVIDVFVKNDLLFSLTLLSILSWLGGIILLVINRDLYRLMEGYGRFNPLKLFKWIEKRRYLSLTEKLNSLDNEYSRCLENDKSLPASFHSERKELLLRRSVRFPDRVDLVLPTPFGNTLRSFEIYPRVMYGLEGVDGWLRLMTVIPKAYHTYIDIAKAQVDLWVNTGMLSFLLILEIIILSITHSLSFPLVPVILILAMLIASPWRARRLAVEWGDLVKSAFDVYRFTLIDLLGLKRPQTREEEKTLWTKYSQAIVYRSPTSLPELRKQL